MAKEKVSPAAEAAPEAPEAPVAAPAAPKVDADRKARWAAFLELASTQNATFELQKANGEFDMIPDSFL